MKRTELSARPAGGVRSGIRGFTALTILAACVAFSCGPAAPPGGDGTGEALQYVSASGDDANDGLAPSTPLKSIHLALERCAAENAEIRVAVGTYARGAGLPGDAQTGLSLSGKANLVLSGGWDEAFSAATGQSVLEGPSAEEIEEDTGIRYRMIDASGCDGLRLSGFVLRRGYASGAGAGIKYSGSGGRIEACEITDCTALSALFSPSTGGGISINGDDNVIDVTVSGCAASRGGGLWMSGSRNAVTGTLSENRAERGGGAYAAAAALDSVLACAMTGNKAVYGGGAYVEGAGILVTGAVSLNSATGVGIIGDIGANVRGGGVYLAGSDNRVSGAVSGNSASFETIAILSLAPRAYGGGVYEAGSGNEISGEVSGNTVTIATLSLISLGSGVYGGGIYATGSDVSLPCEISGNEMAILGTLSFSAGGGLCLSGVQGARVTGEISGNLTRTVNLSHETLGNGIYVYGSTDVEISGAVISGNSFSGILGAPQQIRIASTEANPVSGLVIEDCAISGGTGIGGTGIQETGGTDYRDVTGQALVGNVFGSLDWLYRDFGGTALAMDSSGIAALNTPGDPAHGAGTASGNSLE